MRKMCVPLEVKSEDIDDKGIFKGYGSTFGGKPDSYGDIVEYGAFKDTLANGGRNGNGIIPVLYQHRASEPIGLYTKLEERKKGLYVEGELNMDLTLAREVLSNMKKGILNGLSIGFDIPKDGGEWDDKREVFKIYKADLWEISIVTFPANVNATITSVKNAIENFKSIRDIEYFLKESGKLSNSQALAFISKMKEILRESESLHTEIPESKGDLVDEEDFNLIMNELKQVQAEMFVHNFLN